ncbi:MAG: ADP-glyceromanno-heptose 6-epimerase [Polyangiales bacterium]
MIIVTGGAGFIGSNLVLALNRLGRDDLLIVDNLQNASKHKNLNLARFQDYLPKEELLARLPSLGPIEAILHQGACSNTTESDGRYMMQNNFEYSKQLLAFAEERAIKFIYASSASVYGNGDAGFREEPACEYPLNVYGFSKLVFDNYVRARLRSSPAQIVGLRYFNVYGPQERHKARMASVAMHLFDQLRASRRMQLFEGSDKFQRDFLHVDDAVAVNLFFLQTPSARGIFNCGSGVAGSFLTMAETFGQLYGSGEIDFVPFPSDLDGKYQRFTQADMTQLRAAGCDHAFKSLHDGLDAYFRVLKEHDGYRR